MKGIRRQVHKGREPDPFVTRRLESEFLAPDIVKAAVEGRLPRGYGLKRLVDLPMAWPHQWRAMTLSLAFLSPALAQAAIDGRLPRGFGVKRLIDLPVGWSDQWSTLGLKAPAQSLVD